ncbi:hypothetical protein HYX10_02635 [Candidatus Woesearchaeota archaeon]|nr:hypothetical protein [Candidatus Woesearchaeota archaeon]
MSNELNIYYDEEGDFLEISSGKYTDGYFKNLGDGIFERIDKATNKVTGIAVHGFRKRTKGLKDVKLSLPVKMQLTS